MWGAACYKSARLTAPTAKIHFHKKPINHENYQWNFTVILNVERIGREMFFFMTEEDILRLEWR